MKYPTRQGSKQRDILVKMQPGEKHSTKYAVRTFDEIGAILGISAETARKAARTAIVKVRKAYA